MAARLNVGKRKAVQRFASSQKKTEKKVARVSVLLTRKQIQNAIDELSDGELKSVLKSALSRTTP